MGKGFAPFFCGKGDGDEIWSPTFTGGRDRRAVLRGAVWALSNGGEAVLAFGRGKGKRREILLGEGEKKE